jgi:hypothetical protein
VIRTNIWGGNNIQFGDLFETFTSHSAYIIFLYDIRVFHAENRIFYIHVWQKYVFLNNVGNIIQ